MAIMGRVRDYDEAGLIGKTFDTGGIYGMYMSIKEFYGDREQRMVSVDGIQGEARFPMGSIKLADILNCNIVIL